MLDGEGCWLPFNNSSVGESCGGIEKTAGCSQSFSSCDGFAGIIPHVWLLCPNCRSRFQDAHGDLKQYSCSVCGNATLVRVRSEQERSRDALAGMAAGAAVGAAIGELPGALIGGIIGLVLGALRTPTIEQSKR